MSHKIITLPKQLANQIAAGEVVERPMSVVKELVENAIDAWASSIKIRLKNGWIDFIEVWDNGSGIEPWDIEKALEKYSTSKIKNLEDLHEVMTFGFRGEALASISSVSRFSMSSNIEWKTWGRNISTTGGENFIQKDIAHDKGTTIQVEDLFFNTPARLNYLKKPRTEYMKTYEFLQKIALAYPKIHFSLEHDEKQVFNFPENQTLKARIYDIYGQEFSENMLELSHEFWGIKISGYITDPKISFRNKNRQVLFVNKRVIGSPLIFKAISDGYNRFIAHGSYSGYVLFVDIDPTQVDVNVHPRKMEVRFAGESHIFRSVYHGVKNVLERVSLDSTQSTYLSQQEWRDGDSNIVREHVSSQEKMGRDISNGNKDATTQYYTGSGTKFKNYSPYKNTDSNPAQVGIEFSQRVLWSGDEKSSFQENTMLTWDLRETPLGRIVWQAHNSYIIVQTQNGITLLDQHALAERVIYEKLASNAYKPKMQQILWWIWIHLTVWEKEVLENFGTNFVSMGFEVEILSHNTAIIQAIPDFVNTQNIEKIFREILWDISELGSKWLDEVRHKIWAFAACRSAIKFGDPLTIFEMNALLKDASVEYSATCPHGRPVVYDIDLEQLQKKYER